LPISKSIGAMPPEPVRTRLRTFRSGGRHPEQALASNSPQAIDHCVRVMGSGSPREGFGSFPAMLLTPIIRDGIPRPHDCLASPRPNAAAPPGIILPAITVAV
jgi:hypothetical protein